MRKPAAVLLLLFCVAFAHAQESYVQLIEGNRPEPVRPELIREAVSAPSSPYFYPVLADRYNRGDSTLTLQDYRHLYYGYAYSGNYNPHEELPYADSVANTILRDRYVITAASSEKLIGYIGRILQQQPFNLRFLNMMTYICEKAGDSESADVYARKFNMVLRAIVSSGTGLDKDNPWWVLYRSDAASLITIFGGEANRRTYVTKTCEYYKLKEKIGDIKGFYFDFSYLFTVPDTRVPKHRFEFNPYTNPRSDRYLNRNI